MRIAVIGSGYVGLVSSACFADFGHAVVAVDNDPAKVAMLRRGEMPIYEPGLADLVASNARAGRLSFTTDLPAAVAAAEVVMIAVGTPSRRGDGHADLSYVYGAAREIAAALDGPTVVVTKSTVPVGTGDEVERIIRESAIPPPMLSVASNPEFLREGAAIRGFQISGPDRGRHRRRPRARKLMRRASISPLSLNQAPIDVHRRAERSRADRNTPPTRFWRPRSPSSMRLRTCAEKVGADVQEVARGIGHGQPHRREISACRPRLRRLVLSEGYAARC